MHLQIRSISTTRCDDLARATEAQDGKKNRVLTGTLSLRSIAPFGLHCQVAGTGDCGSNPPNPLGLLHWAAWSRLLLVPPPKYSAPVCCLVVTILSGVLVVLCLRLFAFKVAPKVLPCVGCFYPLHHFGASWRCSALLHWGIHPWCSRSPFGHPLRHVSIRSGPCAPFLLLSAAASRLLVSLLCVGVPVFVVCSAPSCAAPLSLFRLPLIWGACSVFWFLLVFCRSSRVVVPSFWCSGLLPRSEFVSDFLGATQLLWSLAASPPPPFSGPFLVFGFCLSGFGVLGVCWWAPCLVCGGGVCLGK